ncbi:MAG: sodium:alanine symporter family protein [Acidobacteriota bacterium]
MEMLDRMLAVAVDLAWGLPLLVLLVGGGAVLLVYSRFLPFFGLPHAIEILRGKYDRPDDPGQITHLQALSTALAATVGMGNIGGVAIAITQGGPGALFWMWIAAVVGMATKFFSCTLAVMYRGRDSLGVIQGGPMYFIEVGLGPRFKPLAVFFSLCGMVGCLALFQANQMAEVLESSHGLSRSLTGVCAMVLVGVVIVGGVTRIARVASALVPAMCGLYLLSALYILWYHRAGVPAVFQQIFHDAFTGTAAAGAAAGIGLMAVIQTGIKRAAFSNEAGIGTAPMAHGAARTTEPVREGLVAMMGPAVDTLLICTLTALIVLVSGHWRDAEGIQGVTLTAQAFETALGGLGRPLLTGIVICFALSTMFGYSYYGKKCFSYLFGAERSRLYDWFYLATIWVGSLWTARMVVNLIDTAFALMAFPNMLAVLLLSPRVMAAARDYYARRTAAARTLLDGERIINSRENGIGRRP